jgi:hypothetical protein
MFLSFVIDCPTLAIGYAARLRRNANCHPYIDTILALTMRSASPSCDASIYAQ